MYLQKELAVLLVQTYFHVKHVARFGKNVKAVRSICAQHIDFRREYAYVYTERHLHPPTKMVAILNDVT